MSSSTLLISVTGFLVFIGVMISQIRTTNPSSMVDNNNKPNNQNVVMEQQQQQPQKFNINNNISMAVSPWWYNGQFSVDQIAWELDAAHDYYLTVRVVRQKSSPCPRPPDPPLSDAFVRNVTGWRYAHDGMVLYVSGGVDYSTASLMLPSPSNNGCVYIARVGPLLTRQKTVLAEVKLEYSFYDGVRLTGSHFISRLFKDAEHITVWSQRIQLNKSSTPSPSIPPPPPRLTFAASGYRHVNFIGDSHSWRMIISVADMYMNCSAAVRILAVRHSQDICGLRWARDTKGQVSMISKTATFRSPRDGGVYFVQRYSQSLGFIDPSLDPNLNVVRDGGIGEPWEAVKYPDTEVLAFRKQNSYTNTTSHTKFNLTVFNTGQWPQQWQWSPTKFYRQQRHIFRKIRSLFSNNNGKGIVVGVVVVGIQALAPRMFYYPPKRGFHPRHTWLFYRKSNARLAIFNELQKAAAKEFGIPFVDVFDLTLAAWEKTTDGFHYNAEVQGIIVDMIIRKLSQKEEEGKAKG
eukprot:PhM_4_TR7079/c0_g1_i2/m.34135